MRITRPSDDFYYNMRKYWGTKGYWLAVFGTFSTIKAACTSYFLIMAQMNVPDYLIPDLLVGQTLSSQAASTAYPSQSWVSIFLFLVIIFIFSP